MQRYRLPGYETQLLGELQRQQNSAQFCDTLLQTEGISVPTHSCVLAALSPNLSQKLLAIPSPPSGQKRQLRLQAVEAQTLLKLVGLLYSGKLDLKGGIEHNPVLAAAHQLGVADLVKEKEDEDAKEAEPQGRWLGSFSNYCINIEGDRVKSRKMQDAQVQTEGVERRDPDYGVEKRSSVSRGTQTVKAPEKGADSSFIHSSHTRPLTPEPAPCVVQSPDLLHQPSASVANPTLTPEMSNNLTVPVSLNEASNSPRPQDDHQSSEYVDTIQVLTKERTVLEDGQTNDKMSENQGNGSKRTREDRGEEKRHANGNIGMKRLDKLNRMVETTQISIKVKLRRRTKGEVWEVVRMQDTDDTLSLLSSLTQDDSRHKRPQIELTNIHPQPFIVHLSQAQRPGTQVPQPATTNSPKPPAHSNTTSDSQPPSADYASSIESGELASASFPQPQGSVEESDEQIEKLLEDIMMGLNILPDLERDCEKSHLHHNGEQSRVHPEVTAAECVCYQNFGAQSGLTSTDTGIPFCATAQDDPNFISLSSIQQLQQHPLQHHSSVTSIGQTGGGSHQRTTLAKTRNTLYHETHPTRSVIDSVFDSCGQKQHYPALLEPPSQEELSVLKYLPLSNGDEMSSFSNLCMDDMRLPPCLSPISPFSSTVNDHFALNNIEQLPPEHGRPWLTEHPASLQFPLYTILHREDTLASLCQDTSQKAAELKSHTKRMKGDLICEQYDIKDGPVVSKRIRKCPRHPQDEAGAVLLQKKRTVSSGTKSQLNLGICSVSLSRNNVLAKQREMSARSSNMTSTFIGKPNQNSTITERLKGKTRSTGGGTTSVNTGQTRIKTREFLRKTQETQNNTNTESSSPPIPEEQKAAVTNQVPLPRRKPRRARKVQLEGLIPSNSAPPIISQTNHNAESEPRIEKDLPKDDIEKNETTKKRLRRRKRNGSAEDEAVPLKKASSAEADCNNDCVLVKDRKHVAPKRLVNLKEFKNLIKRQHLKTRKAKENKETNETVINVEDTTESSKDTETNNDISQLQDTVGIGESHLSSNVIVDKNHNQIFHKSSADCSSQEDVSRSCDSEETRVFDNGNLSVFSFHVLGEEVARLSAAQGAETEQPQTTDEGSPRTTGVTDILQTAANEQGSPHSDSQVCQDNEIPLDHILSPLNSEESGSSLSEISVGCKPEVEEEEEVDVLHYSPDNVPQTREWDVGPNHSDTTEDEEDVHEIDVTGDEAE